MRLHSTEKMCAFILQDNGRISIKNLAEKCSRTSPPIMKAVRRLEEKGIIKRYHAELDANLLGFTMEIFVSCKTSESFKEEEFEQACHLNEYVRDFYRLVNEPRYLLRIICPTFNHFHQKVFSQFLKKWFKESSIYTSVVLNHHKKSPIPFIEE